MIPEIKKHVLFVCIGNACRSQMAEAFARTVSRLRGSATVLFIAHHVPESLAVDMVARIETRVSAIDSLGARQQRTGA